jgi:hypothetical protein
MQVHLEPLVSLLRVFEGEGNYGDPYELALTVRYLDQTTIEILGLDKPVTPAAWRAIRNHLEGLGITEVRLKRRGEYRIIRSKN